MSKVHLIASGKGGTGKTMFAVNYGATLALQGHSVVIIDMDLGMRNLDLYCGLENNVVYDVFDVLTGVCRIKQALIRDRRFEELYVMAAPPAKDDGTLTPLHMKVLCSRLRQMFDYIIIDAPSGMDDGLVLAAAGADDCIIVTTPEYSSLRDADTLDRELSALGMEKRYLVLNRVVAEMMAAGYVPRLRDITTMLRPVLAGVIQQDENIHISTNLGVPIVMKSDTYIRKNFDKIVNRIENAK
ncbi:MAG: septum site-determining protein MinD [Clostridia bacterium]|nr:septum site-determining protein MinD [Clostridia bacterium]MDO5303444.1 septum site-determining protein MinD [Clostridia bacterium]